MASPPKSVTIRPAVAKTARDSLHSGEIKLPSLSSSE